MQKFVMSYNKPGEFMDNDKIERLQKIAQMNYLENGQQVPLINEDELLNLSIRKGSITEIWVKVPLKKIDSQHVMISDHDSCPLINSFPS